MAASNVRRPLEGVRVVEFGHVAAGPFAGMLLADLGADVVKVEGPQGDQMRNWPPLARADDGTHFSHSFAGLNRNKRSVLADLKDPEQHARVRELCLNADAVVENYRPGSLARLGLGYEDLSPGHRGLAYCSISGFGQTGPDADLGAYDVVIQAMSGLMSVTGTVDGEMVKSGVPVSDFVAGLYAALAVVSHLPLTRDTGHSVWLDTPMLDCMLAASALQTSAFWGSGEVQRPRGTRHPGNAPYQAFLAADGQFVLAAGSERLWREVCAVIGQFELAEDPRFATQDARVENQLELEKLLDSFFGEAAAETWISQLRARGVPAGPINTFADVLSSPGVTGSGLVRQQSVPIAGTTPTTVFPVRVSGQASRLDLSPPLLGEHTDEVLAEWGRAR